MRKAKRLLSGSFLRLEENNLYVDSSEGTTLYSAEAPTNGVVVDFDVDVRGLVRVVTKNGDVIKADSASTKVSRIPFEIKDASIDGERILVVRAQDGALFLYNDEAALLHEYSDLKKRVWFCLLTQKIAVAADSSAVYARTQKRDEWTQIKMRSERITGLISLNRPQEFCVRTRATTRILGRGFHVILRPWALDTICMDQCPTRCHFFAHLDKNGLLRVGDDDMDFCLQEINVDSLCWDLGVLWAHKNTGWIPVAFAYGEQLFDLRAKMLEDLRAPIILQSKGKFIDIIEAFIARPAMSEEILKYCPSIYQRISNGTIIDDVKQSLEDYIVMDEEICGLIGELDLLLDTGKE